MGFLWEYVYYKIIEISSLSDWEYVSLIGNYNNLEEDDEEEALRSRGYNDQQIKYALKDKQGSSFKSLNVVFHTKNNLKYPYFSYVLTLYSNYKRGVMPFPGSVSEQPAKIIEIFQTLEQLELERQENLRKTAEKENAKRG